MARKYQLSDQITGQITSTVLKHKMLTMQDHVLIALSGGPDSSSLALLLAEFFRDDFGLALSAHYVDHGLRPEETPEEIRKCEELCKSLDITFTHSRVDLASHVNSSTNMQERARELRYKALETAAANIGANRIAMAHTLDDQAETFFMRILRGAGPSGLASIPPVRGAIIRPLIETRKSDLLNYLEDKGVVPVEDSSNLKDKYMRNRLRQTLMPILEEINPSIVETIGRTTEVLSDEERYFFIQVTKALMRLITSKGDDHIELFLIPLETLDRAIARRVLRRAIEETRDLRSLGHAHVEAILRLVKEGRPGDSLDLPGEIKVIRKYSTFLITAAPPVCLETHTFSETQENLEKEPQMLELPEARLALTATITEERPAPSKNMNQCALDADKTNFPLTVRARRDGDFFLPQGMGGKRKKLQDYLVDEKVPRYERDGVPIVTVDENIAWIAGLRADHRYAADDNTVRFLLLKLTSYGGS